MKSDYNSPEERTPFQNRLANLLVASDRREFGGPLKDRLLEMHASGMLNIHLTTDRQSFVDMVPTGDGMAYRAWYSTLARNGWPSAKAITRDNPEATARYLILSMLGDEPVEQFN